MSDNEWMNSSPRRPDNMWDSFIGVKKKCYPCGMLSPWLAWVCTSIIWMFSWNGRPMDGLNEPTRYDNNGMMYNIKFCSNESVTLLFLSCDSSHTAFTNPLFAQMSDCLIVSMLYARCCVAHSEEVFSVFLTQRALLSMQTELHYKRTDLWTTKKCIQLNCIWILNTGHRETFKPDRVQV